MAVDSWSMIDSYRLWHEKFRSNGPMVLWIHWQNQTPVDFLSPCCAVSVGTHDYNVDRVTVAKPMMGSQQEQPACVTWYTSSMVSLK